MENKQYLTIKETAEKLRMSRSWLYLQVETGKIPHVRFGNAIRFDAEVLDRWIKKSMSMDAIRG